MMYSNQEFFKRDHSNSSSFKLIPLLQYLPSLKIMFQSSCLDFMSHRWSITSIPWNIKNYSSLNFFEEIN